MNLIEKLYNEWAWRTKTGVPDMSNPEDKAIFDKLLNELAGTDTQPLLKENSASYDKIILDRLIETNIVQPGGQIPRSNRTYKFPGKGGSSYFEDVYTDDKAIWEALWNVAPPAKGTGTASKGVGAGEVGLYWLYNYSNSKVKVTEDRVGGGADLQFNGVGVEVKAAKSHTAKIGLGRFSEYKEDVRLLTIIFGLNTLTKVLQPKELEGKVINPTNFRGTELIPVFDAFNKFASLPNLSSLASQYGIFNSIYNNVQIVQKEIKNHTNSTAAAGELVNRMLSNKLSQKPGFGGFLVNLKRNGSMKFFGIDKEKLNDNETVLSTFTVQQSKIGLNYSKVFG